MDLLYIPISSTLPLRSIPAGELLVQSVCQNGLPPQIKDLKWSPGQQHTEFITREHKGPCNLLCTAGERHLRVWSFASPKAASSATVVAGSTVFHLSAFESSALCLSVFSLYISHIFCWSRICLFIH